MFTFIRGWLIVFSAMVLLAISASAGDLKIAIPERSQLTPVQKLNRDGVDFIRKHQYEKAEGAFYKAYLFDPGDPFTLYNLGYISELQGQLDRASNFYKLASEQATDAIIDRANFSHLKGKPMKDAVAGLNDTNMRINHNNVEAMRLLTQNRAMEADQLLTQTLALDPKNPFTLNNLGVAKESEGESEDAMKFYLAAANSRSTQPVMVTVSRSWRGKPVSEMAADSAKRLADKMRNQDSPQARASILSERGVSAANRNDWPTARQDFLDAYKMDPNNAFSLNNLGYLSEMQGDLETAQFFYERARQAQGSNAPIGLATRRSAEGARLFKVAGESDNEVDTELQQTAEARRREAGPVQLKHRDNTPVAEPQEPPAASSPAQPPTSQSPQQ